MSGSDYDIRPIFRDRAFAFIEKHHRHHPAPLGWLFGCAAYRDGQIVGVIAVGRPVARGANDGLTSEVTRLCVLDENKNLCSVLYGRAKRASAALGFQSVFTYTRADEAGTSLLASGFEREATVKGRSWDTPSRRRIDTTERCDRIRWRAWLTKRIGAVSC